MKTISQTDLFRAIKSAWSRSTSVDPSGWSPANPSWGQCAVTALVIQDALGGDLIRSSVRGTTHYFNLLPSGEEVDLTREQFGGDAFLGEPEVRDRSYVLGFPDTVRRYAVLRQAVEASDTLI